MKLLWNFPLILSLIALLGACSVTIPNARPPAPTSPYPQCLEADPVALPAPAPISTSTPSKLLPKILLRPQSWKPLPHKGTLLKSTQPRSTAPPSPLSLLIGETTS